MGEQRATKGRREELRPGRRQEIAVVVQLPQMPHFLVPPRARNDVGEAGEASGLASFRRLLELLMRQQLPVPARVLGPACTRQVQDGEDCCKSMP